MLDVLNRNKFLRALRVSLAKNFQSSSKNVLRTELLILLPQLATKMITFRGKTKDRTVFSILPFLPAFTPPYFIHADTWAAKRMRSSWISFPRRTFSGQREK